MLKKAKEEATALDKTESHKRLSVLRQKSFDELIGLPGVETETHRTEKNNVEITTYRDHYESDVLQIAVQWYFHIWLGYGRIGAEGFTITKDNVIRDMDEKILWQYT